MVAVAVGISTPVFASLAGEPMATTKSPTRAALLLPRVTCAAVGMHDVCVNSFVACGGWEQVVVCGGRMS